ncbi:MAG: glycosyltransferase family 2 protein [Acetobacter sp.]|uniref:glycosyltransferase family 2 protein n=1 Tax=Acetobacter sp. TaxID=440 RepID=UPI0039E825D1
MFARRLTVFTLQHLLLPGAIFGAPADLYARIGPGVRAKTATRRLELAKGGAVSFDTYFNTLSIAGLKRSTLVDSVFLQLHGVGRITLCATVLEPCGTRTKLWAQDYDLAQNMLLEVPWAALGNGLLYCTLDALEDGVQLHGGRFATATRPAPQTRLGIVITHYNRQTQVVPAIARLRAELLDDPDYRDCIELVVVDNSRNLTADDAQGAILLPNENYGGSGGFARGLLYLRESGRFTHCLFMDDDASCESESIRRAFALQRFAKDPALAISGALLEEQTPYRLFEQGALFRNGSVVPRYHGYDVREPAALLELELQDSRVDYGAWWFFCFRIDQARAFPFPFFVRGDDILFSLINPFSVATFNGIACWGESFQIKENPSTRYLGVRATLCILLMLEHNSRLRALRTMLRWFLAALLSCNYASARAVCMAIRDTAQGPQFWLDNLDMRTVRAALAPLDAQERMLPLEHVQNPFDREADVQTGPESRLHRLWRLLTLNGLLLPAACIGQCFVRQDKGFRAVLRQIFRRRGVLYVHEPTQLAYLAVHDRRAAFGVIRQFLTCAAVFLWRTPRLERAYSQARHTMTTEQFWRDLYSKNTDKGPV